jgi:hypothetical protein
MSSTPHSFPELASKEIKLLMHADNNAVDFSSKSPMLEVPNAVFATFRRASNDRYSAWSSRMAQRRFWYPERLLLLAKHISRTTAVG